MNLSKSKGETLKPITKPMFSAIRMGSVVPDSESSLRKARLLGVVFLIYAIALPFVVLILPATEVPADPSASVIAWAMLLIMPVEILFIYLLYRYFTKKPRQVTIMGQAILMYVFAMAPSIYAFAAAFIDSAFRSLAVPLGLVFSLAGFWFALHFLSLLGNSVETSNQ
jgi:hypothetical protein